MSETPKEIAERFIGSGENIEDRRKRCADAIEVALNAERERAAKIAKKHRSHCLHCETALAITAEIRGKQ